MMVEIKDVNEFHEIVKKKEPIYYRDPEYRSNFRRVEPENGIRSMNPFTHPNEMFYRMVDEGEAQQIKFTDEFSEHSRNHPAYAGGRTIPFHFFQSGWECAKKYFNWRQEQE